MDRRQPHDDGFVEDHLASLVPPAGWRPDKTRALAQVRERDRRNRTARRRWMWIATAASVICLGVLAAPASCEAASAATCRRPFAAQLWNALFPHVRGVASEATAHSPANFRETGAINAPITCEIYSDYQCPACAAFFLETMPQLDADFVRTGKIRILHRDFPLPQHRYADLAARYANAAGQIGQYGLVVHQLFKTQRAWEENGDIDTELLQVLPPGMLQKVRGLVSQDHELSINADAAQAREDQIHQTPSLVIVFHGQRQVIAPVPAYPLLKRYLDSLK